MRQDIKDKIIANGVKNLKEFGYPDVDNNNIMTDMIYVAFFKSILKDSIGQGFDEEINSILKELEQ